MKKLCAVLCLSCGLCFGQRGELDISFLGSNAVHLVVKEGEVGDAIQAVAALENGAFEHYNGFWWENLLPSDPATCAAQVSADWSFEYLRAILVLKNTGVKFYNGLSWEELHDSGWSRGISQLSVDWTYERPGIVLGLKDGALQYYNGRIWKELQNSGWGEEITSLDVSWGWFDPLLVLGLEGGDIMYYDGKSDSWYELLDNRLGSAATQISVEFWKKDKLRIVAGLKNGSVIFFDGENWQELDAPLLDDPISSMSVDWKEGMPPRIVCVQGQCIHHFDGEEWK